MYDIIWIKDNQPTQYTKFHSALPSLDLARDLRVVSGDLVVFAGTTEVVPSQDWLWPWERDNPKSYAFNKIKKAKEAECQPRLSV